LRSLKLLFSCVVLLTPRAWVVYLAASVQLCACAVIEL